jgi:hypothetical protein
MNGIDKPLKHFYMVSFIIGLSLLQIIAEHKAFGVPGL